MGFYDLMLDSSEFCILCANLQVEFNRSLCALKRNRLDSFEKKYFLGSFVPFFEKIESIRLKRQVKYDLNTGEHYDVENGNKGVSNS